MSEPTQQTPPAPAEADAAPEEARMVLYNNAKFTFTLVIDAQNQARLEIQTSKRGPDMTTSEDVVVVCDGRGYQAEILSFKRAVAPLGPWSQWSARRFVLAARVGEFFESWEFDPRDEEE